MSRGTVDGEFHRQVALFTHADQCHRTPDAGHETGADPPALVDDPGQVDAAFLENLSHDLAAIDPAGFLIVTHTKQDGTLRPVALLQECFRRLP